MNLSGRYGGTGATRITGGVDYDSLAGLVFNSSLQQTRADSEARR